MSDGLLSITEVGQASGLQSSALRYYEKAGLIEPAARFGGRRHYSTGVLQRLALIRLLQDVGFTIAEIGQLIERRGNRHAWRSLAGRKLEEIEAHIRQAVTARDLLRAALECSCSVIESCELVTERRGPHARAEQTLMLRMGRPAS